MATAVGLCSKPNTVEFRLLWMTRICGFYFPSDQRRLMLERDAIGPMEKIYVECVYHTGGLRVRWALGLNHSHIYILMKHKDMRLMTEPRPPSPQPQPALGTPSVCKTRYYGRIE